MPSPPERRSSQTYQKIVSILFAGLLTASGLIWSNSQKQIEKSLNQVEKLMELINGMQQQMALLNYKMEMLQIRLSTMDGKIDNISTEKPNEFPSKPRFR